MRNRFGLMIPAVMMAGLCGFGLVVAETLMDPMRPPTHIPGGLGQDDEGQAGGMNLTVTYISEKDSFAVINNIRLRKGAVISGMRITDINPGVVVLDRDGEQVRLNVLPTGLKKYSDGK